MSEKDPVKELKAFKESSGWSYDRLAKELGIHSQTVTCWFQGKHKPSALAMRLIKKFLQKQNK